MHYLYFLSFLHIKSKSLCSSLATSNRQNPNSFIHYYDLSWLLMILSIEHCNVNCRIVLNWNRYWIKPYLPNCHVVFQGSQIHIEVMHILRDALNYHGLRTNLPFGKTSTFSECFGACYESSTLIKCIQNFSLLFSCLDLLVQ